MPAPKAVLRDIHDHGLDPRKPYTRTSSSGRLAHDVSGVVSEPLLNQKPELVKKVNSDTDEITVVASSKKKAKTDKPLV